MIEDTVAELVPVVGVRDACAAVGRARATHYRHHRRSPAPPRPEPTPARPQPRALDEVERKEVLRLLHSGEHVDEAPATVYAKLLDEGTYLASVPTMYRLLRADVEVRERRRQATHPARVKPELVASAPNECWSARVSEPTSWPGHGHPTSARLCPRGRRPVARDLLITVDAAVMPIKPGPTRHPPPRRPPDVASAFSAMSGAGRVRGRSTGQSLSRRGPS